MSQIFIVSYCITHYCLGSRCRDQTIMIPEWMMEFGVSLQASRKLLV